MALGSSEENMEHEAQQISLAGALFRIRIDQGHPIRPILDSTRFIVDQIARNARTGRHVSRLVSPMSRSRHAARIRSGDNDS